MARFDFKSPGADASVAIQDFIRQRNVDERQALLDALNEQNMRHGQQMDLENLSINQSQNRRAETAQDDALFGTFLERLPENTDLSTIDPAKAAKMRSQGLSVKQPAVTPRVNTAATLAPPEGATPEQLEQWAQMVEQGKESPQFDTSEVVGETLPEREVYAGGKEFRAEGRQRGYIDEAINDPRVGADKNPELLQSLLVNRSGAQVPASVLAPTPSWQVIKPTGQPGPVIQGTRGRSAVEVGYPPQPNASQRPTPLGIQGENVVEYRPDGTLRLIPIPGSGAIDKPLPGRGQPQRPPDIVPQQLWNQLRTARMAQTTGSLRQAGIDQATASIKAFALSRGVSPQTMADVDDIIADEAERAALGLSASPIPEILNRIPNATPAELQQISSLLYGFLSN